jgi:hypothetical protein
MYTIIFAPFTPEQVEALNEYQQGGWGHPFTCCGPDSCRDRLGTGDDGRALVATENGWVCRTCDYNQDWAHSFMLGGPPDWFQAFSTASPGAASQEIPSGK